MQLVRQNSVRVVTFRKSLDTLGKRLGIQSSLDWYGVTHKEIASIGGTRILNKFRGSIAETVEYLYPEFDWHPWLFRKAPKALWKDVNNHRSYLDWLGTHIGIQTPYEWLRVSNEKVFGYPGGKRFLFIYKNSMLRALRSVYQEINWKVWRKKHHYEYRTSFDQLATTLHIHRSEDWYSVHSFDQNFKMDVLWRFGGSLPTALRCVYPEFDWIPWFFDKTPNHFWTNSSNHRKLFDWIGAQLGIDEPSDWYLIRTEDVLNYGAGRVLAMHGGSLISCLQKVYPEHEFLPWMFERTPRNYWNSKVHQREYMDWLCNKLKVEDPLQWIHVNWKRFIENDGGGLMGYHKGCLSNLLQSVFPESFPCLNLSVVSSGHAETLDLLKQFVKEDVVVNYRLTHGTSMYELDIYVPALAVAIEFQGAMHYKDIEGISIYPKNRRHRDAQKAEICKELGITLYEIPYWWDSNISSLHSRFHVSHENISF